MDDSETARLGQACKDALALVHEAKRRYYAGQASYADMQCAAVACLEARQEYEQAKYGRAKTRVTALTVANLLR